MLPQAAIEIARVGRPAFAQVAPQGACQIDAHRALHEQVEVFAGVARKHHQRDAARPGELAHPFGAVRPVALAAEVVDDDHARMPQHLVQIEIHRGRLAQVQQVRQPHRREALRRAGRGQQRQRGVGRAEDDDLGGVLRNPRDHRIVVDETARLGGKQVHQAVSTRAAACSAAASAAVSRSAPISTRRVAGVSPARQRRSK